MLRVYCRDAEMFVGNAAAGLLLEIFMSSHPQGNCPGGTRPNRRLW
jgi:hypothetical protein